MGIEAYGCAAGAFAHGTSGCWHVKETRVSGLRALAFDKWRVTGQYGDRKLCFELTEANYRTQGKVVLDVQEPLGSNKMCRPGVSSVCVIKTLDLGKS